MGTPGIPSNASELCASSMPRVAWESHRTQMLGGIDVGSSAVKAGLVDPSGGVVGDAQASVKMFTPHPGWAEADPQEWWAAICQVVPALLAQSGIDARAIDGIATSGMVPAVL